jgi:hypothetical protein
MGGGGGGEGYLSTLSTIMVRQRYCGAHLCLVADLGDPWFDGRPLVWHAAGNSGPIGPCVAILFVCWSIDMALSTIIYLQPFVDTEISFPTSMRC